MYTDTKNLANLTNNNTNAAAKLINNQPQDEDKFKLKKVWKPILRLMSRKSSLTKNGKRDGTTTVPNNINLNNANNQVTNKDAVLPQEDCSAHLTHKLPLTEFWQTQHTAEAAAVPTTQQTISQPLEFISKASIDKTPLDSCSNCIYGRNCQHTQFHQTIDINVNSHPHHAHVHPHHPHLHPQQNFNYFDAEDGCFVWSDTTQDDIDENALREWLWQNSWQFAENATMC